MADRVQTYRALERLDRLAAGLPRPDRPKHHYQYDPDKALGYTATTLAWAGDPAAQQHTRTLIEQLQRDGTRPRRLATARLDLALALLAAGEREEAAAEMLRAIESNRIAASSWWRVSEVLTGLQIADVADAEAVRAAYQAHRPATA